MLLIESVIAVVGVIIMFFAGLWIGREYGTLEAFVLALLDKLQKRIGRMK